MSYNGKNKVDTMMIGLVLVIIAFAVLFLKRWLFPNS